MCLLRLLGSAKSFFLSVSTHEAPQVRGQTPVVLLLDSRWKHGRRAGCPHRGTTSVAKQTREKGDGVIAIASVRRNRHAPLRGAGWDRHCRTAARSAEAGNGDAGGVANRRAREI